MLTDWHYQSVNTQCQPLISKCLLASRACLLGNMRCVLPNRQGTLGSCKSVLGCGSMVKNENRLLPIWDNVVGLGAELRHFE